MIDLYRAPRIGPLPQHPYLDEAEVLSSGATPGHCAVCGGGVMHAIHDDDCAGIELASPEQIAAAIAAYAADRGGHD